VKHFSLSEWADYSRGVVSAEQGMPMQKHLQDGCKSCEKTVEMWKSLAEFALQEARFTPPPGALRVSESYFSPLRLELGKNPGFKLTRRMFDSLERLPQPGFRGSNVEPRHLMYQCGDVFIDMHLRPKAEHKSIALAGQVVDAKRPDGGVVGVLVSLVRGNETLFDTTTSDLGEFLVTVPVVPDLRLLFRMEDGVLLVVLPDPDVNAYS
jgi:hypothetical protein